MSHPDSYGARAELTVGFDTHEIFRLDALQSRYDVALEVVKSLSYNRWRTYDPEDSLRFFGVRLHEAGMIKTNPQKLINEGTDWRFLNELKKELKA